MKKVTAHYAKAHLLALLRNIKADNGFVITCSSVPVAKLIALQPEMKKCKPRVLGADKRLIVPADFDAPLWK